MTNSPTTSSQSASSGDLEKASDDLIRATNLILEKEPEEQLAIKQALLAGDQFIHDYFLEGGKASQLLSLRTTLIDHLLIFSWQQHQDHFNDIALIAVGGYGRGELHPYSDIDIAILLPDKESSRDNVRDERLSRWITSLWDLNLDIGHSVRSLTECEAQARGDITVITNLMEARFLCGKLSLYNSMVETISPENMWNSETFFEAKVEEQRQRHSKFQTNAYRLEPNVKESQGGLRDFQTISWVCQRQFNTRSLQPLVERGLLEPNELDTLDRGLDLLWKIRYLLHHVVGRREDRLLFNYQKDIAHSFGYTNDENNLSIEQLMQQYYRTVMSLQRLNEIILQGIGGMISGVTAASEVEPINERFHLRNGFLEVTHPEVFKQYPSALLELFLVFGETAEAVNVRSHTVRLIRANLGLINDQFRSDPIARSLFVQIFRNPNKLTRTIRLMNRYGVLAAYLPAFDKIFGRMQYDLFHIYTVDEHTILVIRNLRRMALSQFDHELPHGSKVFKEIRNPHILYLSALFHDIAKGRNGDHSILGAEDAKKFAINHGLDNEEAELLEWTVRHHLLMSITAQRKDIDDPDEQLEFARQVRSIEKLNHLYLLTVSDIRATNPELWNSFKQSLLQSLYRHALLILQRGLDNPLKTQDVIEQRQNHTRSLLDDALEHDPRVEQLWRTLGDDYFRLYQAIEIARHTEILLSNENTAGPLISLRYSVSRGSTEILIYTPDHQSLFAVIASFMEQQQLNVLSATIHTTETGHALDTFHVLEATNLPIEEANRAMEVKRGLIDALSNLNISDSLSEQRIARQLKYFSVSTQISFNEDDSGLTEMHITAADRPGILSSIGSILMQAEISVRAARIATLGERIDDVFLISNQKGQSLSQNEKNKVANLLQSEL